MLKQLESPYLTKEPFSVHRPLDLALVSVNQHVCSAYMVVFMS